MAATDVVQMEHKTNVPIDKVWHIKFNNGVNQDKLSDSVMVYNPLGIRVQTKLSYDPINNIIKVEPPTSGYINGQTYSLSVYDTLRDVNSSRLKESVIMNFTIKVTNDGPRIDTSNKKYIYKKYDKTLDQVVDIQSKNDNPVNVVSRYILDASDRDVYEYLNPKNFESHDYAVYQFLTLNYIGGITAEDVNLILKGEGILEGQGKTFLDACKKYNINIAYIIAHAILETGHGKSALANGIQVNEVGGIKVESKTTYNMFGIGAWDEDPIKLGSERAYREGWFSVAAAIEGGIKYISAGYINNSVCKQNTLYKMRWNPENPATHQYATDIGWSYKQSYRIKEILDKCKNAYLVFEIPQYK
jgi:beta-N-acetylglucosaminidase